jgi:urea carboxylase
VEPLARCRQWCAGLQARPARAAALLRQSALLPGGEEELLRIKPGEFSLRTYRSFLAAEADSIAGFRLRQRAAFEAERERWRMAGQADHVGEDSAAPPADTGVLPDGVQAVATQVPGSVWKLMVAEGDLVAEGDPLLLVESMKMEFSVVAPRAGRVWRVGCREGVAAGQHVVWLELP